MNKTFINVIVKNIILKRKIIKKKLLVNAKKNHANVKNTIKKQASFY